MASSSAADLSSRLDANEEKTDKIINRAISRSFEALSLLMVLTGLTVSFVGFLLVMRSDQKSVDNFSFRGISIWQSKIVQSDFAANQANSLFILLLGVVPISSGLFILYASYSGKRGYLMLGVGLFFLFTTICGMLLSVHFAMIVTLQKVNCEELRIIFQTQFSANETALVETSMQNRCCGSLGFNEFPISSKMFECCTLSRSCTFHKQPLASGEQPMSGCCSKLIWNFNIWSFMLLSIILVAEVISLGISGQAISLVYSYTHIDSEFRYWKKLLRTAVESMENTQKSKV
ncbi:hypothetical protein Ciccas_000097 [Cichlidogyrus casuarinus]|uniref:Tetraspanin n=1 Tax=Cichlidogyrus casuarinus TaxID=1844966 RepID=A0ABD2QNX2_9PLAT